MIKRTLASIVVMLALVGESTSRAAADSFALICNAEAKVPALSRAQVKALYTGKSKTFGGAPVVVVIRPEADVPFTAFVDQVFGIPTKTLLLKIHQEVFKGEMTKPLRATSDEQVVQGVAAQPGMLGIISAEGAGHLPKSVTVIAIGG